MKRRKLRKRFKKVRKLKRRLKKKKVLYIENIFNYPDRRKQPLWVSKKIAYIVSYYRMHDYMYNSLSRIKHKLLQKASFFNRKNFISSQKRKIKTFKFNIHSRNIIVKSKDLRKAKSYKELKNVKSNSIALKAKNFIWSILCRIKFKYRKRRKKTRRLRFRIRILKRSKSFQKYSCRYKTKEIWKKLRKIELKKSLSYKSKNNLRKLNKNFRLNLQKRRQKIKKSKYLLKALKQIKKRKNRYFKRFRSFIHSIKYRTITKNDLIRRKKGRKFFWLTNLKYKKRDIKNTLCLSLLTQPHGLRKLLTLKTSSLKYNKSL